MGIFNKMVLPSTIILSLFVPMTVSAPMDSQDCNDPEQCPLTWAQKHLPLIRFDGDSEGYCFPDEATNINNGVCKKFNPDAPIYYKIIRCGDFLKLAWHLWYGLQRGCDPFGVDDGHDDDWEHITINFVRNGDSWEQDSVTYSQHGGFYTRRNTQQNPDVYVGKVAHGHYDTWCQGSGGWWIDPNFCSGMCGYWEDFRNDNVNTRWMPHNIKHVSEVTDSQVNRVTQYKYFDNVAKNSCDGLPWRCVGALAFCACWRNNHIFYAPVCDV